MELIRPTGRKRRHVVVTHQASSVRYRLVVVVLATVHAACAPAGYGERAASSSIQQRGAGDRGEGGRPADGVRWFWFLPRGPRAHRLITCACGRAPPEARCTAIHALKLRYTGPAMIALSLSALGSTSAIAS